VNEHTESDAGRASQKQSSSKLFSIMQSFGHSRHWGMPSEANPFQTGGDEEETKLFLPVVRPHWPALPDLTAGTPPLRSVDLS